ncbi:MAG: hypothetical protein HOE66_09370 [Planctomycetes bacterium]|nr:hypothetical protein [Planctomycetota bacterium]MBT4560531.1 hypothetical protein [Planctomycetota bacterium]
MTPLIKLFAVIGVRGDWVSFYAGFAYVYGAWLLFSLPPSESMTAVWWVLSGLLAELLDGGLARLRGPSTIGFVLSKFIEHLFIMLLVPAMTLGLYRADVITEWVLILGVLGPAAHFQFRMAFEEIMVGRSLEELSAVLDKGVSGMKRYAFGQFVHNHDSFTWKHRIVRIVRENMMESSGIQPLLLLAAGLLGHLEWYVIYYGCVQLAFWLGMTLAKMIMMKLNGGRLL